MSSTKLSQQSSGTDTPAKNDAVSLRRSSRICRKAVQLEKENGLNPSYKKEKKKKKKVVESEEKELQQKDINPFVKELSQKSGANTLGICTTPNTGSDHDKQPDGTEPVDIPSSPEDTKPNVDPLWSLEHVLKPYSDDGIPAEDLKQLSAAASIIKSDLVSRLTSSTDELSIDDMIKLANQCFNALRILRDNHTLFYDEVCKLIEGHQKLKLVAAEKENWTDCKIKTQYIKQMDLLSEVTEKLRNAQNDLSRAKMRQDALNTRKSELTTMLLKVVDELNAEEARILTLTSEWNRCKEDRSGIVAEVEKLCSREKEAAERLEAINAQYEAVKEEMENMKNHLLHLVSKH